MSNGSDGKKLSAPLLVTLGLTGMMTSAIRCGPCLDVALPDTGDTGDTGDTEDDQRSDAGGDREAARQRVLDRGVLPDDVAKMLRQERTK